ncbi:hypothetical protein ACFLUO_09495, partial [Chloroflexota bacterium]
RETSNRLNVPAPAPTPAPAPKPEVFKWKLQGNMARGEPFGHWGPHMFGKQFDEGWIDWIEEATDGRLEVEFVEPNGVYPNAEALTNIGSGVIEASHTCIAYYGGEMPEAFIAATLPFSNPGLMYTYDLYWRYGWYEKMRDLHLAQNIVFIPAPMEEVCHLTTTFAANSPDDVAGRKIRIWGAMAGYIKAIGGLPVTMSYSDVYMGIKLGTVDGATIGAQALEELKLKEIVKGYVVYPSMNSSCNAHLINKDAFDALPQDIQDFIMRETPLYFLKAASEYKLHQLYTLQQGVKEYGLELYTWSEEDTAKVRKLCAEQVWPEYGAKSAGSAELLKIQMDYLELMGLL